MSLALLLILFLWILCFGLTLTLSHRMLVPQSDSFKNEFLVRGIAATTVAFTLGFIAIAAATFSLSDNVFTILPVAWALSILPLFIPPIRIGSDKYLISSHGAVMTSLTLGALGGVAISIFMVVALIASNPELI